MSKVVAHYFVTGPPSLGNKRPSLDYWYTQMLNPAGENSKHAASGGFWRDMPDPLVPRPRLEPDWRMADQISEINNAMAFGVSGWLVDVLSVKNTSSETNWVRTVRAMDAAAASGTGFTVCPMPDMTAGFGTQTQASFVTQLAELLSKPAAEKHTDGRPIVSPFKAEAQTASWWAETFRQLKTNFGIDVAFWPCFLDYTPNAGAFAALPQTIGLSNWGDRNPAQTANDDQLAADCHTRGKMWMQPVSVQDERPSQGIYDEANNTEQLRTSWQKAIDSGAERVQLITWNDYSEGAVFGPSVYHGFTWLQLSSWFATKYTSGAEPAISTDTLFLSHRKQPFGAAQSYVPAGVAAQLMKLRPGSSIPRDTVEVLSFLAAPGRLRVVVGPDESWFDVAAGMVSTLVPLLAGQAPRAELYRGDVLVTRVVSRTGVTNNPYIQDLQYVGADNIGVAPWFNVQAPPPAPAVSATPWAAAISPDPTPRIKKVQTATGVTADGWLGNQTLTGIEQAITDRDVAVVHNTELEAEVAALDGKRLAGIQALS